LNSFGPALVTHDTGVKVLTRSSLKHGGYDDLTPSEVDTLIEELAPQHDYLIIDMPPYLSSALKGALARCHRVILVTASAPHALGRIKSVAALLNGLGVAREQLATVICDKGCILRDVPSATIEPVLTSIIEVPLLGVIPYSAFGHEWEA
jgi:MinD-like ATPase involved in chromosome partitioning or flagellar assembly